MPISFSPKKETVILINRVLVIISLFFLIGYLYLNGATGSFYYDDYRPLSPLPSITDYKTSLIYIFSETSGPLGRPISMMTFLFNVNDWPNNSNAFFHFNIGLHITNGLLVFLAAYWVTYLYSYKLSSSNNNAPYRVALITAMVWLVLPMNVSASLIAIQRMTGLSAFFVFLGITLYTYGLAIQSQNINHIKKAQIYQVAGLILATLLAMFSKENGMLLPVYILVLEVTLLRGIKEISNGRKARLFIGGVSLIIVLTYLTIYTIKAQNIYPGREFTLIERVMTQPQILLTYLKLSFIPEISKFNPFHDNYQHVTNLLSSYLAFLSIVFWVIALAFALIKRKAWPVFSFAVLWFLAAHLLESTVIGLELYFEHRNYIALVGPCIALALFINNTPKKYKKYTLVTFGLYWVLLSFSLDQTTKLWGDQGKAAQTWFLTQKGSSRAAEHLALVYLQNNQISQAHAILEHQVKSCPTCMGSKVQALLLSCIENDKDKTLFYFNSIFDSINSAKQVGSAASALEKLHEQVNINNCNYLTLGDLKQLNSTLLDVQGSSFNKKLAFLINLHQIAMLEGDKEENIRILKLAYAENDDIGIANILITHLLKNKNYDEAYDIANNKICNDLPLNPILKESALSYCNSIRRNTDIVIREGKINNDSKAMKPGERQ